MGYVHTEGLEKATQELGKKWWEQGGTEHKEVSHINCFAKFSALSRPAFPSSGQPQPFSPKRFVIGNQNTITKIILFHWCGQIEKQAPNYASAFTPRAEAYVICLTSPAHPPPSPTSLLPTTHSLESLPVGILHLPPLDCIMP